MTNSDKKISWLKAGLEPILKWLKYNWLVLVVIGGITFFVLKACETDETYQTLFEQYGESITDHQNQINELKQVYASEQVEIQRQLQEYLLEMKRLENDYRSDIARLEKQREDTRTTIIRNWEREPTTLPETIRETFGIPIE
jgi:hypothetical protein